MNFAYRQETQDFLTANPDIELFELFILDANGVPRSKLLHRDRLLAVYRSGRPLPSTILGLTMNGEDVEDSGLVWDVGDIGCRIYPLSGSLVRLPWQQTPTAAVQISVHLSEDPPASVTDPRHLLVRVINALRSEGYHPMMAAGLGFYLLDRERGVSDRPQPARDADGGHPRMTQIYSLRELEQIEPLLADLYAACKTRGLPAHTTISEYAPDQVEVTLGHSDTLVTMDQAVRYKRLVRGIAHKHGMLACFMAKPFDDLAGAGMHLRVSLAGGQDHNLFVSSDPAGTLLLRQAVGNTLASLLGSLLLFCPNASSYRHFQANSCAPLVQTWGVGNRIVNPHVPDGPASSRHIEHCICDADTNPHLAAAALLAGVHRGIRKGIGPGTPVKGNGHIQAGKRLPTDWLTALDALQDSEWARETFGEPFLDVYLTVKRAEYRQFMGEASEQNWRWYLAQA